jgi:deoxyribonuclease V
MWPPDGDALRMRQRELAGATPVQWIPAGADLCVAGCWVCFPRGYAGPGRTGDPAWSAAVLTRGADLVDVQVTTGAAGAPYTPGMLALRIGHLVEQAARMLATAPDVLLVDGTGRDHPRRAGFAVHLGAELDLPTVGVTHRPLLAEGEWPGDHRGDTSPLRIGDEVVGCWLRAQAGVRPIVVHPGWRVDLETAVDVVVRSSSRCRTPEPLRHARHAARAARSRTAGAMS